MLKGAGMDLKEEKAALELMQTNAQKTLAAMLDQFRDRFKEEKVIVTGAVVAATLRIEAHVFAEDERFKEIYKYFSELEESIAYPETRIVVKRIDAETK